MSVAVVRRGRFAAMLPALWIACSGESDVQIGSPKRMDAGASSSMRSVDAAASASEASLMGAGGGASGASIDGEVAADAATGGSTETGGAADSTGDASVIPDVPPQSPPGFFTDGFLQTGPWGGYMFTYVDSLGSTVSPTCTPAGCNPMWGSQPCVSGSVAEDAAGASYVGLAFRVNGPKNGSAGTWAVTGSGLFVSVWNAPPGGRVSVQEPNPKGNDQRYCAPLPPGGSGVIPWSQFETWCWGEAAHPSVPLKQGTKLEEVAVQVTGSAMAATPYDLCLVNIAPQ